MVTVVERKSCSFQLFQYRQIILNDIRLYYPVLPSFNLHGYSKRLKVFKAQCLDVHIAKFDFHNIFIHILCRLCTV